MSSHGFALIATLIAVALQWAAASVAKLIEQLFSLDYNYNYVYLSSCICSNQPGLSPLCKAKVFFQNFFMHVID